MRKRNALIGAVVAGALMLAGVADAQPRALTGSECQGLRQTIAGHAQVSDGVRRLLASSAPPAAPVAPTAAQTPPVRRADAIRNRLAQFPAAREQLDGQRAAAMMKFDLSRALRVQTEIEALDSEKAGLEKELAGLPASPPPVSTPPPVPVTAAPAVLDVDRAGCQNLAATHERAMKIRQKELGAREGQAGAIPLLALKGPASDQMARELAAQFAPWPTAASQIGLLDQDGDGRLDGFVDVPAEGIFRLYRQRSDGTLTVETFVSGGSPQQAYSETTRPLDEGIARQAGTSIADLLSRRPAGPVHVVG
ncbi:MAG: hypothetical protein Q8Q58_03560, partial [Candidatus Rokubacteria bacterium]|nr:hypothetical protein [Candidatus Rokubacteria bacterium]